MTTIMNRSTGQIFTIDRAAGRIARLRRRIFAWVEVAQELMAGSVGSYASMVTLTYRSEFDWRAKHIRDFMLWVKKKMGEHLLGYSWVAELQERGAMHYHVLLVVSRGGFLPKPDKCGGWVHGSTRVEKAETLFYICKYTSKGGDKNGNTYPRQARIFGCFLHSSARQCGSYQNYKSAVYPKWLRDIVDTGNYGTVARRKLGGGWEIGQYAFGSPYIRVADEQP